MTNDPSKSEIPEILDWLSRLHGEKSLRRSVAPHYDTLYTGELPWASLDQSPKDTLTLLILDTIEAGLNPPEHLRPTLQDLAATYAAQDKPEIPVPEKSLDDLLTDCIAGFSLRFPSQQRPLPSPNCGGPYLQQTAIEIHTRRTRSNLLYPRGLKRFYWHLRDLRFPNLRFRKPAVTRVNLITGKVSHRPAHEFLYHGAPAIAIEFQCSLCSTIGTPLPKPTLVIRRDLLSTNMDWSASPYQIDR